MFFLSRLARVCAWCEFSVSLGKGVGGPRGGPALVGGAVCEDKVFGGMPPQAISLNRLGSSLFWVWGLRILIRG